MKALLKRITTIRSASAAPNLDEVIVNIMKAFLDGGFMLEMYSSKNGMGTMFVKSRALLDIVLQKGYSRHNLILT